MTALHKSLLLMLVTGLAACQHTPPPFDSELANKQPSTRHSPPSATMASQPQAETIITLHLAQEQPEPPLVAVDIGGTALYALPQPVLTQADMLRITPVTTPDQLTFLLLEMNQSGTSKLRSITSQAQGHYLLLSVQGQLVNITQIGETISDGRLLVGTQNAQHSQAIIKLMQGKQ